MSLKDRIIKQASGNKAALRFLSANYKSIKKAYLYTRQPLQAIRVSGKDSPINIYHGSVQRTASQWIKHIFGDRRIRKFTNLSIFPQHEYEINEHILRFPRFTFVPGLYISWEQYIRIKKPENYKTFYIIRDPRDLVLSWYKSVKYSHRPINDSVVYYRKKLQSMDEIEGLKYAIKAYRVKLEYLRDWVNNAQGDPNVVVFKFENLTGQPVNTFGEIFSHCKIDIPTSTLKVILEDYTKEKMRKRDTKRRKDNKTHYSETGSDWKKVFNEEHKELFSDITGSLAKSLGYS